MELEEGGEANRAVSEEKSHTLEAMTLREENSLEVVVEFPFKLKDPSSFFIPCMVGI